MLGSCRKSVRFNGDYLLLVTNLPFELNEDGIRKVFNEYGCVKSIMAMNEGQYAFVLYSTYAEAENAIKSLDDQPPLYLRVQFGRKQLQQEENDFGSTFAKCNMPNESGNLQKEYQFNNPASCGIENNGDNIALNMPMNDSATVHDSRMKLLRSKLPVPKYYIYPTAATYPMVPFQYSYYPYYNQEENNSDGNIFWSKGFMTSDAAGRRYVTMGRGCISYNIADPKPRIINDIGKIYESRQPGCYKYGIDQCKMYIGKCINCSNTALLSCSICETFYCSRACQITNWPTHQRQCMKISHLTSSQYKITSSNIQSLSKNNIDNHGSIGQMKIIDNAVINNEITQNNSDIVIDDNSQNNQSPTIEFANTSIEFHNENSQLKNENIDTINATMMNSHYVEMNASMDLVIENFLSEITFTNVIITAIKEPGDIYYVQRVQDIERLDNLMGKLNDNIIQSRDIQEPIIGKIYGIMYDNIWHRGLVLSLTPTIVDYIDWGTIDELPQQLNIFKDIGKLAEIPRFAQLIKLSKFKRLELNDIVSVKKINITNDNAILVINVEILNKKMSSDITECQSRTTIELPNILNMMNIGMTINGEIGDIIDNNTMRIVVDFEGIGGNFENLLNPLKDDCDAIVSTFIDYQPSPHDWVAVQKHNDRYWYRGYVLKSKDDKSFITMIASIDEGTIITQMEKIIPLPVKYKNIEMFSVIMKTESTHSFYSSFQPGKMINLTVVSINHSIDNKSIKSVNVILNMEFNMINELKLYQWKPWETLKLEVIKNINSSNGNDPNHNYNDNDVKVRESNGNIIKIKRIELKDNSNVVLQSYRTPHIVFLRSLEPDEIERHHRLIQKIAKCGNTSAPLDRLPKASDYVLAQYIDENYYRAIVILADEVNQDIKVLYIDYGDIQVTKLDKLKIMPQSLMYEPCCVKKVILHGIKSVSPTEQALKYLSSLVINGEPLVYKLHSVINSESHAILKDTSKCCINDHINELLTPNWERDYKLTIPKQSTMLGEIEGASSAHSHKIDCNQERIFELNDIELRQLGKIGETVSGLLLETIDPGFKYVFGLEDNDMIMDVTYIMPHNMKKYSEVSDHYIPRSNELCIALFDDNNWYRGCCLNSALSSNSALIYFIDFGNTAIVQHLNIRKMTSDFLKPPAFGCICNIEEFINSPHNDHLQKILTRLQTLLLSNQTYKIEIVNFDGEIYNIRLPEINKKLSKEGLLP